MYIQYSIVQYIGTRYSTGSKMIAKSKFIAQFSSAYMHLP